MKKAAYNIMPGTEEILKALGEQIKLARLRRDLSAELVAERAGISRSSLWKVESGNPAVAMGIYAAVLHALGNMDSDLLLVAKDDLFGRQLQDMNLLTRKRASRSWRASSASAPARTSGATPATPSRRSSPCPHSGNCWTSWTSWWMAPSSRHASRTASCSAAPPTSASSTCRAPSAPATSWNGSDCKKRRSSL